MPPTKILPDKEKTTITAAHRGSIETRTISGADLSLTHLLLTTVLQLPLTMLLLHTTHTSQPCALFKRSERSVRHPASTLQACIDISVSASVPL